MPAAPARTPFCCRRFANSISTHCECRRTLLRRLAYPHTLTQPHAVRSRVATSEVCLRRIRRVPFLESGAIRRLPEARDGRRPRVPVVPTLQDRRALSRLALRPNPAGAYERDWFLFRPPAQPRRPVRPPGAGTQQHRCCGQPSGMLAPLVVPLRGRPPRLPAGDGLRGRAVPTIRAGLKDLAPRRKGAKGKRKGLVFLCELCVLA